MNIWVIWKETVYLAHSPETFRYVNCVPDEDKIIWGPLVRDELMGLYEHVKKDK